VGKRWRGRGTLLLHIAATFEQQPPVVASSPQVATRIAHTDQPHGAKRLMAVLFWWQSYIQQRFFLNSVKRLVEVLFWWQSYIQQRKLAHAAPCT